jgi:type IV secretion system protein VirB4
MDWISLLMNNRLDGQTGNIRSCIMDSLRSLKRRPKKERTLSDFINFTSTQMREVLSHYKDSVIDGDTKNIVEHDWLCFEMGSMFEKRRNCKIL